MTNDLQTKLTELATELDVVGVSAGILIDGEEHYAFHGVTNIESPIPVDEQTLFQFGSTGKTYTATAIMRLVDQGKLDLDAPVRTYLPELTLKDSSVAEKVTVLQLLNHTAGWSGDVFDDTGNGDDALTKYVEKMADIEQVTPLGATVSYNNASLSLAGRLIEKVTGLTFEAAIKDLLLDPLGLDSTWFFPNDIMTRRFVVGHNRHEDGTTTIARPWGLPRSGAPAGGMSATAKDQLGWARFHLGDGTAPDGTRLLSSELLEQMKQPTVDMRGSALGDYVGVSWLLRDIGDVRVVGHGGTTNGQYSDFTMVPERNFAAISMTNSGPNGSELNHKLVAWALEHYLGVKDVEPEPIDLGDDALVQYVGRYDTVAVACDISALPGKLQVKVTVKPEMAAILREAGEDVPDDEPPMPLAFISPDSDAFIVPDGPAKGMKGYFQRNGDGKVDGVHLGGRLATRTDLVPA